VSSLLVGISATDPLTFAAVSTLIGGCSTGRVLHPPPAARPGSMPKWRSDTNDKGPALNRGATVISTKVARSDEIGERSRGLLPNDVYGGCSMNLARNSRGMCPFRPLCAISVATAAGLGWRAFKPGVLAYPQQPQPHPESAQRPRRAVTKACALRPTGFIGN
jgi:hypothetical protein